MTKCGVIIDFSPAWNLDRPGMDSVQIIGVC